ncbi:MAG: hypothetical protein ACYTF7_07325 [Planctomycetota bacterium]|jgi:sugar phosphate isomerase/epimerase
MNTPRPHRGLSLTGWNDPALPSGPRRRFALARQHGYQCVTLDATDPRTRPRDLDRSSRRDLGATLQRDGLGCAGFDLWIAHSHLEDSTNWERITDAVRASAECLHGIAEGGSINMALPAEGCAELIGALVTACESHGVALSDHSWPPRDDECLRVGFDPASVIVGGDDPHEAIARVATRAGSLRLSDIDETGRVPVGEGSVNPDLLEASAQALGCPLHWIVDIRGVARQQEAIRLGAPAPNWPIVEPDATH